MALTLVPAIKHDVDIRITLVPDVQEGLFRVRFSGRQRLFAGGRGDVRPEVVGPVRHRGPVPRPSRRPVQRVANLTEFVAAVSYAGAFFGFTSGRDQERRIIDLFRVWDNDKTILQQAGSGEQC